MELSDIIKTGIESRFFIEARKQMADTFVNNEVMM